MSDRPRERIQRAQPLLTILIPMMVVLALPLAIYLSINGMQAMAYLTGIALPVMGYCLIVLVRLWSGPHAV